MTYLRSLWRLSSVKMALASLMSRTLWAISFATSRLRSRKCSFEAQHHACTPISRLFMCLQVMLYGQFRIAITLLPPAHLYQPFTRIVSRIPLLIDSLDLGLNCLTIPRLGRCHSFPECLVSHEHVPIYGQIW